MFFIVYHNVLYIIIFLMYLSTMYHKYHITKYLPAPSGGVPWDEHSVHHPKRQKPARRKGGNREQVLEPLSSPATSVWKKCPGVRKNQTAFLICSKTSKPFPCYYQERRRTLVRSVIRRASFFLFLLGNLALFWPVSNSTRFVCPSWRNQVQVLSMVQIQ